ncbi:MAG TPA: helix-turn-helix domain-containing protein [Acidimicrobiales bacterium]|jgi:AcrR family transcriptional regulator
MDDVTTEPASPEVNAPREGSRRNSRAALVDAALVEFSAKGYEAATVVEIAERAGVTTGALYAHFAGKFELFVAALGLTPPEVALRSKPHLSTLSWTEASHLFAEGMSALTEGRTLLLLDVLGVARREPEVAAMLRRGLEGYLEAMGQATQAGIALGLISPAVDTDNLVRVFALLSLGMAVFGALGEVPPSESTFSTLAELLLQSPQGHVADAVDGVRNRSQASIQAQRDLDEAIVRAAAAGYSLRQIGEAAGMSHERVRQLLRDRQES